MFRDNYITKKVINQLFFYKLLTVLTINYLVFGHIRSFQHLNLKNFS